MADMLLEVRHLSHRFSVAPGMSVQALDNVSFSVAQGEIFGLVGESGSGKSTLARCIMNLYRPQSGQVLYQGIDTCKPAQFQANKRLLQTGRQLIFQDSASSLNGRMTVQQIITEPLSIQKITPPRKTLRAEAAYQLERVGLSGDYLDAYPHQLSGGQRQRLAIARALTMQPRLMIADEPVAALDVSIQAQIINLFQQLQQEQGFTFLFIAHDLAMVRYLCHRVGVLYHGKLVEVATAKQLFAQPQHPYTRALLSAIPIPDPVRARNRPILTYCPPPDWQQEQLVECEPGHYVCLPKTGGTAHAQRE